ncbi:MAG: hypothetical protein KDA75_14860, partial [Planctomycetaceae bacterium]|nr:hypothetical protein [Planctomycetaceae bacterium]
MEREQIDAVLSEVGAPARDYWENDLEISVDAIARLASDRELMDDWIGKRAGRQVDILHRNLGMNGNGSVKSRKKGLQAGNGELTPYLLVQEFALRKSKLATMEVASSVLPQETIEMCRKSEDDFDTLAICFALYAAAPTELRRILHLDKLHKRGAARMVMKQTRRRPNQPLEEFLTTGNVTPLLAAFDESAGDGRKGELMNIMPHDGHQLVFVRRCFRPSFLLRGSEVVHGHEPEWIVLDFFDGAKRVNICSTSVTESLEIANRIASAYYGEECEYENESGITYARQITRLLEQLRNQQLGDVVWVELHTNSSPLVGEKPLSIAEPHFDSIGPAVADFEQKIGPLIDVVDRFESIKVIYAQKRVKLIFEKREDRDDEYVVRYTDHTLNPVQRKAFEDYMRMT